MPRALRFLDRLTALASAFDGITKDFRFWISDFGLVSNPRPELEISVFWSFINFP